MSISPETTQLSTATQGALNAAKDGAVDLLNAGVERAPEAMDAAKSMGNKLREAVPPSVPTWALVGAVAVGGYFTYHAVSKAVKTGAKVLIGVGVVAVAGRAAKLW